MDDVHVTLLLKTRKALVSGLADAVDPDRVTADAEQMLEWALAPEVDHPVLMSGYRVTVLTDA